MRRLRPTVRYGLRVWIAPLCVLLIAWTLIGRFMPFPAAGINLSGNRYRIVIENGGITFWRVKPTGSFVDTLPGNPKLRLMPQILEVDVLVRPNPNSPSGYDEVLLQQLILPAWIVVAPLIGVLMLWIFRAGIFIPRNRCGMCDYDTRGLGTGACPECGHAELTP